MLVVYITTSLAFTEEANVVIGLVTEPFGWGVLKAACQPDHKPHSTAVNRNNLISNFKKSKKTKEVIEEVEELLIEDSAEVEVETTEE